MDKSNYKVLTNATAEKVKILVNVLDGGGTADQQRAVGGGRPTIWATPTGEISGGILTGTIQQHSTTDGWRTFATDAIIIPANDTDVLEMGRRYLGVRSGLDDGRWTVAVTTGGGGGVVYEADITYLSDVNISSATATPTCDEDGALVSIDLTINLTKTFCTATISAVELEIDEACG